MEKYVQMLREAGADDAMVIDAATIQTAPWTVYKCQFGCGNYGQKYCCPPNAPSYRETQAIIDCFSQAILFRVHAFHVITPMVLNVTAEMFRDGHYKTVGFGDCSCNLCTQCSPNRCSHPGKALPSMEACGIDVFATVRANGWTVHWMNTPDAEPELFGLILVE